MRARVGERGGLEADVVVEDGAALPGVHKRFEAAQRLGRVKDALVLLVRPHALPHHLQPVRHRGPALAQLA